MHQDMTKDLTRREHDGDEWTVLRYLRLSDGDRSRAVCRMLERGVLKIGPNLELVENDDLLSVGKR